MMGLAEDVQSWQSHQPDLIEGKCGTTMTLRACREYLKSGRQKYKYHLNRGEDPERFKDESWANGYVLCQGCEYLNLVNDPPKHLGKNHKTKYGRQRDRVDGQRQNTNRRRLQSAMLATPRPRMVED